MVILEVDQAYQIKGIPVTAWMQGVGSMVAIVAAIWGFISLFRKDKNKQSQIDSLARIAEQTSYQTDHLSAQLVQMIESNKLQNEYIRLFQEFLQYNKENNELTKKKAELDKKQNKFSIQPRFEYKTHTESGDKMYINLFLKNQGEVAKNMTIEELQNNNFKFSPIQSKQVSKNEKVEIGLTPKLPGLTCQKCNLHIKFIFEDIEGNKYAQEVHYSYNKFEIGNPVEVK